MQFEETYTREFFKDVKCNVFSKLHSKPYYYLYKVHSVFCFKTAMYASRSGVLHEERTVQNLKAILLNCNFAFRDFFACELQCIRDNNNEFNIQIGKKYIQNYQFIFYHL